MPADRDRYEKYRSEIKDLAEGLSFTEYHRVVEARLLDVFGKRRLDPDATFDIRALVARVFDDPVAGFAEQILQRHRDTLDLVNDLYADLAVDIPRDLPLIRAIETATSQEIGTYKDSIVREISKTVRQGIIEQDSARDLTRRLLRKDISTKANFYAETIAQTQIKTVGRAAKSEKARIAGVVAYEYVGIIRATTRPFCRAHVGTTHHVDTINRMRNGNYEPVLLHCGGWNCIHDWEPDPFAKDVKPNGVNVIKEGRGRAAIAAGEPARRKYRQAEHLHHMRSLKDVNEYVERARSARIPPGMLRRKLQKRPGVARDGEAAASLINDIRGNPEKTYYQFHDGRSEVVFEKDGVFVMATDSEVRTFFPPTGGDDGYRKFRKYIANTWIELDEV